MDTIDITYELEDFYHHLNEATIDRTIFSARFGDGKTEFLKQFKEKYQNEYDFYTLYPVNYQIAPNEQIMEYIKRDLLFQLILNKKIEQGIEIPDSIAFQWYLCNNSFDIIRECMKCSIPHWYDVTILRGISGHNCTCRNNHQTISEI